MKPKTAEKRLLKLTEKLLREDAGKFAPFNLSREGCILLKVFATEIARLETENEQLRDAVGVLDGRWRNQ